MIEQVALGNTGLKAARLGLGTAYGIDAKTIEWAVDQGINYLFWGSVRRKPLARAVRNLGSSRRDKIIIVVACYAQRYLSWSWVIRFSAHRALRSLKTDYLDIFHLGWITKKPSDEAMEALLKLKEEGSVRYLGITTHNRSLAAELLKEKHFQVFHIRYNAANRGAEREIFPYVNPARHAIVSFTATRWGQLLKRVKGWPEDKPVPKAIDCYRFVLSQPKVTLCLTGAKNRKELEENIKALELGPMSEEELAWMREFGDLVYSKRFHPMETRDRGQTSP